MQGAKILLGRKLRNPMKIRLWQKVIIGMVLGVLFGLFFKPYTAYIEPVGIVFLNMIKMVIVPLVFFAMLNGITSVNDAGTFGRLGGRALLIYMSTSTFAVLIGIIFANVFQPGAGLTIDLSHSVKHQDSGKLLKDLFINLIPTNPIKAMADGNVLQVVVFALFTGFALILIGEKGREVKKLIFSCTHLVFKMIQLVIQLTPYGVFAIISCVIAQYGMEVIIHLGKFICVASGAFLVQYILFGVMLCVFAKINPIPFFRKMSNTQSLAFATASSKATVATSITELRKIGVSKESASFVLPLGAAINMDGSAIYLAICAIFSAQIFGIELTLSHYIILMFTTTIGAMGAGASPGGSIIMMSMVLSSIGVPLEGMGVILGIDRLVDMLRTTVNVTGDCTVTLIVDKMNGTFDKKAYYSKV